MRVHVVGQGKVGRSLVRALSANGQVATLESGRAPSSDRIEAEVVLLAVRDEALVEVAKQVAPRLAEPPAQVVAHLAGALGLEPLDEPLGAGAQVARAHPAVSFVDEETSLQGVVVTLTGPPEAAVRLRSLFEALGAVVLDAPTLDPTRYHAALALAANGLGALLAEAAGLLRRAGLEGPAEPLLAPLLRSVIDNAERVGAAGSLSGPVRRGAVATIERHRARLADEPSTLALYDALVRAQLRVAADLGDATEEQLDAIARLLDEDPTPTPHGG